MKKSTCRIGEKELSYVREVLDSQFRTSAGGIMTKRLEERFAEIFKTRYAISFVNGTATLHAALAAAGIGPGDHVIVPPLTMASTAFAVLHAGAVPVFVDVDAETWTIDPRSIEVRLTPQTKAIVPVALYGLPPDMNAIMSIAGRRNLIVVEDDAQSPLAYYHGRILGSIGDAASFSFQSTKHMTSGEGGIVTTNDEALAEKIRRFGSLGYAAVGAAAGKGKINKDVIQDPECERHVSIGWNYRMPELCAAVALGQLERLQELVEMRRKVAELYDNAVRGCGWLVPQKVPDGCVHSYWTYVLKLQHDDISWHCFRKTFMASGGDGIYSAWQLTYLEPAFREKKLGGSQDQRFVRGLCPVAESVQPRLLQLKTNYFDLDAAEKQAEALSQTIDFFDSKQN